jgi:hypothetical protein
VLWHCRAYSSKVHASVTEHAYSFRIETQDTFCPICRCQDVSKHCKTLTILEAVLPCSRPRAVIQKVAIGTGQNIEALSVNTPKSTMRERNRANAGLLSARHDTARRKLLALQERRDIGTGGSYRATHAGTARTIATGHCGGIVHAVGIALADNTGVR